MKPQLYLPIAAALAGFAIGWIAKPAPEVVQVSGQVLPEKGRRGPGSPVGIDGTGRGSRPPLPRSATDPDNKADPAFVARMDRAFKSAASTRDRAKLIRLAEAVDLSQEQLDQFEKMIADERQQPGLQGAGAGVSPQELLEKATAAARSFDEKFRSILTPDQALSLNELRDRQDANRVEARAQRELSDLIDRLDVTTEQRDAMLDVLRTSAKTDQAQLPEGAALLMETSPTAIGRGSFTEKSIEAMAAMGNDSSAALDPVGFNRKMLDRQREQVEKRSQALSGILTPAQLIQYRAVMEAQGTFTGGSALQEK